MRILALVPSLYDTSPGQRFRMEQWDPLLREHGVEVVYRSFEDRELNAVLYKAGGFAKKVELILKAIGRRVATLRSVREFDAVYVFREAALLGPPVFERWAHWSGVPTVFDFDDAVWVPYVSPSNGYLSYLKFPGKTRDICRMSTHVMAGNPYLADYARAVNGNVTIIPTTIDTDKYVPDPSRRGRDPLVIGWSGSYSTVQHLDTLRDTLRRLGASERFRLRVIGTPSYELEGVDVEAMPWRAASEVEDLQAIDIGVMPLPDDKWSKGKCGLKALQYMALGIPTICSPVGVNSEIIRDGENGFIADGPDEWIEKLTSLLRSPELRERVGRAGRETVEAKYSARVQAPRVLRVFQTALGAAAGGREAEGAKSTV